jgi:hypothetical protein
MHLLDTKHATISSCYWKSSLLLVAKCFSKYRKCRSYITITWITTTYRHVSEYQRVGEIYSLHVQCTRWKLAIIPKRWSQQKLQFLRPQRGLWKRRKWILKNGDVTASTGLIWLRMRISGRLWVTRENVEKFFDQLSKNDSAAWSQYE